MILLFILIAYRLDLAIGSNYIKDAVCIAFMVNELISIAENAGLMGIPIPQFITGAIDALKNRRGRSKMKEFGIDISKYQGDFGRKYFY